MDQSGSIAQLAAALVQAQASLPEVDRAATAQLPGAGYSYRYATMPDVLRAVRPVLASHGLAVMQGTTQEDDAGLVVVTTLVHTSGEWMTRRVRVPMAAGKHGPTAQAAGSAFAYGRRIGLVGVLGLITDDLDDDGAAASQGHGGTPAASPAPVRPRDPEAPPTPAHGTAGAIPSACPKCSGAVWDNRQSKTNPKAPDWKCRDKTCVDARGYVTAGWCEKPKAAKPSAGGGPGMEDDIPVPEDDDDLPY